VPPALMFGPAAAGLGAAVGAVVGAGAGGGVGATAGAVVGLGAAGTAVGAAAAVGALVGAAGAAGAQAASSDRPGRTSRAPPTRATASRKSRRLWRLARPDEVCIADSCGRAALRPHVDGHTLSGAENSRQCAALQGARLDCASVLLNASSVNL